MTLLHFISTLSVVVGVAGAGLLTYGVWLIHPAAGFIAGGGLCLCWSCFAARAISLMPAKSTGGE